MSQYSPILQPIAKINGTRCNLCNPPVSAPVKYEQKEVLQKSIPKHKKRELTSTSSAGEDGDPLSVGLITVTLSLEDVDLDDDDLELSLLLFDGLLELRTVITLLLEEVDLDEDLELLLFDGLIGTSMLLECLDLTLLMDGLLP